MLIALVVVGRESTRAVHLAAMSHHGQALQPRTLGDDFPISGLSQVQPAELVGLTGVGVVVSPAEVSAVNVHPITDHRRAETRDPAR